nr:histidine phosphatase superfamily (branch 1) [uncultured bacterium]
MHIHLFRHGPSAYHEPAGLTYAQFGVWIERYNAAGIQSMKGSTKANVPPVPRAPCVFASDLPRSIETAHLLYPHTTIISDAVFREAHLPLLPLRGIRFKAETWVILAQLAWRCGWAPDGESARRARQRAAQAADRLIAHALEWGDVALIGHGFFNRLIAHELIRRQWMGSRRPTSAHCRCTTYTKKEAGNTAR